MCLVGRCDRYLSQCVVCTLISSLAGEREILRPTTIPTTSVLCVYNRCLATDSPCVEDLHSCACVPARPRFSTAAACWLTRYAVVLFGPRYASCPSFCPSVYADYVKLHYTNEHKNKLATRRAKSVFWKHCCELWCCTVNFFRVNIVLFWLFRFSFYVFVRIFLGFSVELNMSVFILTTELLLFNAGTENRRLGPWGFNMAESERSDTSIKASICCLVGLCPRLTVFDKEWIRSSTLNRWRSFLHYLTSRQEIKRVKYNKCFFRVQDCSAVQMTEKKLLLSGKFGPEFGSGSF